MHGSTGGGWKRNAGSRHRAGPRPNQPQNGDDLCALPVRAPNPRRNAIRCPGEGQVVHPAGGESYCRA